METCCGVLHSHQPHAFCCVVLCLCRRWGFWKQLTGQGKEGQQQLLPDSHSPSSPTSQHTLTIQDPVKPAAAATGTSPPTATGCESSSPSKNFGKGMLSSMFGGGSTSPTAGPQQQQKLGVSRINSELSSRNKQPGSASVSVQRRSTDAAGARASTAGAGAGAAKEGATGRAATPAEGTAAAAMPSDPLLQPGMLETVNLKVDGKAVSLLMFVAFRESWTCALTLTPPSAAGTFKGNCRRHGHAC